MAKEKLEFKEIVKTCIYKAYQDNKCVNADNKETRKVGSCQEALCPLLKETKKEAPAGEASEAGEK